MFVNAIRDEEFGVFRPAVVVLGQAYFLLAQRLAMGGAGVLLVRRPVGDVAVDDDQRGPVVGALKCAKARPSISRSLASPTRMTFQP